MTPTPQRPRTESANAESAVGFWGLAIIAIAIAAGLVLDGQHLARKWGPQPPPSLKATRFQDLLAFDERDLDLPVVVLTSAFMTQSVEYYFSPSPSRLLYFVSSEVDEAAMLESGLSPKRIERYLGWRAILEEADSIYSGDPTDLFDSEPKYIVVHGLEAEALASIEACRELKLVRSSLGGRNRWYRAN